MVKPHTITAENVKELFKYNPDTGELKWVISPSSKVPKNKLAGSINTGGYLSTTYLTRHYLVHRIIWMYIYGEWPKNQIDHRDGNRTNNQINNLRDVTPRENSQNNPRSRRGLPVGIIVKHGKFQVSKDFNGARYHIGVFDTEEIAISIYNEAITLEIALMLKHKHKKEYRGTRKQWKYWTYTIWDKIARKSLYFRPFNTEEEAYQARRIKLKEASSDKLEASLEGTEFL